MTMPMRLLSGTTMAFVAILLGYFGIWIWRIHSRFGSKGRRTVGKVVDIEMRSDHLGMKFSPKVEFETLEGQKIVFFGEATEENHKLKGRSVKVIYLPENPTDAEIRSGGPWAVIAIVFLFAALSLFASASCFPGFATW
jgi:hypothetical protein